MFLLATYINGCFCEKAILGSPPPCKNLKYIASNGGVQVRGTIIYIDNTFNYKNNVMYYLQWLCKTATACIEHRLELIIGRARPLPEYTPK